MPDRDINQEEQAAVEPAVEPAEVEAAVAPAADAVVAEAPDAELAPAALPEAEPEGPAMNWYIIHTYSGFENKVAESLKARSGAYGFADRLGQVLIPTEEVVELRNGKKVTSKRLLYPGYVMAQMATNGHPIALLPQFNSYGKLQDFSRISYGMSHWGPRSPNGYDHQKSER